MRTTITVIKCNICSENLAENGPWYVSDFNDFQAHPSCFQRHMSFADAVKILSGSYIENLDDLHIANPTPELLVRAGATEMSTRIPISTAFGTGIF